MSAKTTSRWRTVQDPDLLAWLSEGSDEVRELIVEAKLPDRKVAFERRPDGTAAPTAVMSGPVADRLAVLDQLNTFLSTVLEQATTILKAAGAIAVRATSQDVLQFVNHPLVKSIRPNRKLR